MTSLDYQVLSRRIYSNFPVIGWLLRRWAAWQLAKDDESGEAVAILAEVVTRGQDRAVREMAVAVLNRLKTQDAINGFCRVWVETRHKDLTAILRSRRYVATERRLRVLSALKVGALDVVKRGGVEVLDFLLAALNDRDTQVATAAASCVSALENRVVIDELCRRWVESRSSQLEGIIRQGGYVASQPMAVRVLTALKLNQIQEIRDGGIEVLDCVLKAFDDRDMEVVRSANVCAVSLTNRGAIDELCKRWASSRNKRLEGIIRKGGYIASQPIEVRLLTGLKFNHYQDVSHIKVKFLDIWLKTINDKDREIANIAQKLSTQFRDAELINSLCKKWVDSRSKELEKIILDGGYIASEPIEVRVLSALKFNQYGKILNDGSEILDPLIKAFGDKDLQIQNNAKICIAQLQNKQTIDSLCKKWIESQNPVLKLIIQQSGYEPTNSSMKAMLFFLLGEWQKYEDLDFDQSLLLRAYYTESESIQKLIADKAKIEGRIEWIKILTNGRKEFDVENIISKDWETFVNILVSQPDRKEIWRFFYNAPAIYSKKLLDRLAKLPYKWFMQNEEATVKTLLALSAKTKEDDFRKPLFLLTQKSSHKILIKHTENPKSTIQKILIVISPNGRVLATNYDESVYLWSLENGECLNVIQAPETVFALAISSDNKLLALGGGGTTDSGRYNNYIELWSLSSMSYLNTFSDHTDWVRSLAFTPDSRMLVSGSYGIHLWNLDDDGEYDDEFYDSDEYHDSGKYYNDGKCYHYKCIKAKAIKDRDDAILLLAISSDGKTLASASQGTGLWNPVIKLWNLPNLEPLTNNKPETPYREPISLAIIPEGKILVSSCHNYTYLWRLPNGNNIKILIGSGGQISPDGKVLALINPDINSFKYLSYFDDRISYQDDTVFNYLIQDRISNQIESYLSGATDDLNNLPEFIQVMLIAIRNNRNANTISLWDLSNGTYLKNIEGHADTIRVLAFSPDGNILASGSRDKTISLWDLTNGIRIKTLEGHTDSVENLAFSPNGFTLVSQSRDKTVRLWNLCSSTASIKKLATQDISVIEAKIKSPKTEISLRYTLEFTLALVRLRQQFDIDIEDVSSDVQFSEFDIEIDG